MRRVTAKEADELPEDTQVYVRWSGGNGPFWYVVKKHFSCSLFYSADSSGVFVGFPDEAEYMEVEE